MTRRRLAAVGVALLLPVLIANPARADARGRIVGIQPSAGQIKVTLSAAGLRPGQKIDPATATLSLAGQPLKVSAQAASASQAAHVVRRVILAIDTSGSMAGAGIAGARAAALAYLDRAPSDVQVGLLAFSDQARLLIPLTQDRSALRAAVGTLQAGGNTALYDAILLASRSFPNNGDRQVLLLSDGADDGSKATLAQVTSVLGKGAVALNAVAFRNPGVTSTLGQLTSAAGGRVVSTQQAAGLSAAFVAAANVDNQIVITAELPAGFTSSEGTIVVSAKAAGQSLTDSALAVGLRQVAAKPPTLQGPRPADLGPAFLRSSVTLYIALAALFLGLTFLIVTAASAVTGRERVAGRMAIYTMVGGRGRSAKAAPQEGGAVARGVRDIADRVVRSNDLEARLGQRLDAGGIPLKPAEWLMLHVGIAVLLPGLVLLLTQASLIPTVLSLLLSVLGPFGYLNLKKVLRTRAFLTQMPDVLQLMSGSLSAGYSLPQAVDAVVRQGNEPVATEFNKALVEARIGAPIEDALDDVATRMESMDFHWVVIAIRIQRDVGGNLAEILSTVAATLRERERLRRQVQVLSAEGKISAYILTGLPIVFALYLLLTKPTFLKPLVTDPIGYILLGGMVFLMVVGGFWMKKVVTVDV